MVAVCARGAREDDVKKFLEDKGYPTDGVHASRVNGPGLIALFFDTNARNLFCDAVPNGMGFDPDAFETRFKPEMLGRLNMHTSFNSEF